MALTSRHLVLPPGATFSISALGPLAGCSVVAGENMKNVASDVGCLTEETHEIPCPKSIG